MPRVWRADEARHSFRKPHFPLEKHGRLSARHGGVVARCTGHASENVDQPRLSASSWRQVLVPASETPSPPKKHESKTKPTDTTTAPDKRDTTRRRPRLDRTMGS